MNALPLILLAAIGTAACASSNRPQAGDPERLVAGDPVAEDYREDRVVCRRQRPVGSHLPITVCRTESQMQAERDAAQDAIGVLRPITGDTRHLDIQTLPSN